MSKNIRNKVVQNNKTTGSLVISDGKKSEKKLGDYKRTEPEQLNLFEFIQPREKQYSNTIELYDFMPKYHWGKVERINDTFLKSLERSFECRGTKYKIEIKPARLKDKEGTEREYFPSKREELVEDALRRFATAGQGLFLDDAAGVTFTLYQLQQELKRNGHSYSTAQLKDALLICAETKILVSTTDGTNIFVSSIFETLGLQTREDWKGKGQKSKAFVRFNSLVTESIKTGTFRQLNYEKAMSYKSIIARQLHKRMSHHYTQASISQPYHITLSTIIRDFGLTEYDTPKHNLRNVCKALDEMKMFEVLLSYRIEPTHDTQARNKLINAKLVLTPHPIFVGEVMQANKRHGRFTKVIAEKSLNI
jgi:hypothetical protein